MKTLLITLQIVAFAAVVITAQNKYDKRVRADVARGQVLATDVRKLEKEYKDLQNVFLNDLQPKQQQLNKSVKNILKLYRNEITKFFNNLTANMIKNIAEVDGTDKTLAKYQAADDKRFSAYFGYLMNKKIPRYIDNYYKSYAWRIRDYENTLKRVNTNGDAIQETKDRLINLIKEIKSKVNSGSVSDDKIDKVTTLARDFYEISKQLQMDGFHEDEKQRSDGNSGIKQIRTRMVGGKNYYSNTHTGGSFSAIHDHSNNIRTVGMGEFIGVLNGVEFRTRHNDYRLNTPSTTETTYHKTTDLPFPPVPPSVLNKSDVGAQVEEMRKYFEAFYKKDISIRDYRNYFYPALVYLEGTWTVGNAGGSIDEPFESDRHNIDAKTWQDLQEKVRFTSYAGQKSLLENLAHLPTKVIRFTEDKKQPVLAQWNYRLLSHKINTNEAPLDVSDLKLVVDQTVLKRNRVDIEKYKNSRAAKFDIEGLDENGSRRSTSKMDYSLLDRIMEQIPGKNNYFGARNVSTNPFGDESKVLYHARKNEKLKTGFYNRVYRDEINGEVKTFGFSDRVWIAHTTHSQVAQKSYHNKETGKTISNRVSYAIPVEVILMTPLNEWNPYNIEKGQRMQSGSGTLENPYQGWFDNRYFRTPNSFFTGEEVAPNPADTVKSGAVYITPNQNSAPVATRAAGTRIMLPLIQGIEEQIRQRYPVMPVHGEGGALWKKLNAVEDLLDLAVAESKSLNFVLELSKAEGIIAHTHEVNIAKEDVEKLSSGQISFVEITSESRQGHDHHLVVGVKDGKLFVKECDNVVPRSDYVCNDRHPEELSQS